MNNNILASTRAAVEAAKRYTHRTINSHVMCRSNVLGFDDTVLKRVDVNHAADRTPRVNKRMLSCKYNLNAGKSLVNFRRT